MNNVAASQKNYLSLKNGYPYLGEVSSLLRNSPEMTIKFIQDTNVELLFTNNSPLQKSGDRTHIKKESFKDLHLEMLLSFDRSNLVTSNHISNDIGQSINQKFILFLQGKYRSLKFFEKSHSSNLSSDVI